MTTPDDRPITDATMYAERLTQYRDERDAANRANADLAARLKQALDDLDRYETEVAALNRRMDQLAEYAGGQARARQRAEKERDALTRQVKPTRQLVDAVIAWRRARLAGRLEVDTTFALAAAAEPFMTDPIAVVAASLPTFTDDEVAHLGRVAAILDSRPDGETAQ